MALTQPRDSFHFYCLLRHCRGLGYHPVSQ